MRMQIISIILENKSGISIIFEVYSCKTKYYIGLNKLLTKIKL